MDLDLALRQLASTLDERLALITTDSGARNALVLPFLGALGYDVFDPSQVRPADGCDVVYSGGKAALVIITRAPGAPLEKLESSMYGNFGDAQLGALTDGSRWLFFADLDEGEEDRGPFLTFNLRNFGDVEPLKMLMPNFNRSEALTEAMALKYAAGMKTALAAEIQDPSEEMVRLLTGKVYTGRMTSLARERFAPIVRRALDEFLAEHVTAVFDEGMATVRRELEEAASEGPDIVTTQEEIDGFNMVRAIVAGEGAMPRVVMRDTKSYCGLLFDDNNRKPICRLRFNHAQKYLGLFDAQKNEQKMPIEDVSEIFQHGDHLRNTVRFYLDGAWPEGAAQRVAEPEAAEAPAAEDEPTADEPTSEEPVAEEVAAVEPAAEEPAAEEPAAEEPAVPDVVAAPAPDEGSADSAPMN